MPLNIDKRREMIALLKEVSDSDLQNRLWIRREDFPNSSGIDEVFHFLFDDTDLGESARSEIGNILQNSEEAERIELLCRALEATLDRLGNVGSEAFIGDPQWPSIMKLADSALEATSKTNAR